MVCKEAKFTMRPQLRAFMGPTKAWLVGARNTERWRAHFDKVLGCIEAARAALDELLDGAGLRLLEVAHDIHVVLAERDSDQFRHLLCRVGTGDLLDQAGFRILAAP